MTHQEGHVTLVKMRRLYHIPLILFVSAAIPAFAQEGTPVSVRGNAQDGFVRFVFSGENMPEATVTKADDHSLKIAFSKAVNVGGMDTAASGISPTMTFKADSASVLALNVDAKVDRYRTMMLGKRMFVDVFTSGKPVAKTEEKPAAKAAEAAAKPVVESGIEPSIVSSVVVEDMQAKEAEKKKEAAAPTKPADNAAKEQEKLSEEAMPAPPANAALAPAPAPLEAAKEAPPAPAKVFTGSAIVTVGSTQGLSLAAFQRQGYLWIVVSSENLTVKPVVSGPDAAALGPVDAINIEGGSAYRIKLPEGAYVRPEGAGLIWRLFIEGKKTALKTVTVDRDFSDTAQGPLVHIALSQADSVLRVPDPEMGDDLAVVTVGRSDQRLTGSDKYVDFDVLPAFVGAVVKPKADGMRVSVLPTEIVIGRQGGLRISAAGPRVNVGLTQGGETVDAPKSADPRVKAPTRIYRFADWSLGGPEQYLDSRRLIDMNVASAEDTQKVTELVAASKFMLAQGLPQEALGFVNMALAFMPLLRDSADFQAIRGAILVLAGQNDEGLAALSMPGLETNDEINLWKAYSLAQTGNLNEAQKLIPPGAKVLLASYPDRVLSLMLPPVIDAVLGRGDVTLASTLTDMYEKAADTTSIMDSGNTVSYFRGKAEMLKGEIESSTNYFREAADGVMGPYPVRATLALIERGLSAKSISREDAINKLERFRYAWRGDTLETEVLQRLGLIYVTGGEQRLGLTILRDAATMAPDDASREKLVAVMQKAFKELFSGKTKEKMTPLEAAAVAAEFAELMPAGPDGEQITLNIADKMMAVDLLDRAADLIEPMIERTENMADAIRYAQRAAAIRLTDSRPEDALKDIDKVLSRTDVQEAKALDARDLKAFALLRAKAKDQQKRPDAAFVELNTIPEDADVLKLKADIAWSSQRWALAADALGKLVKAANLDATRPPTKDQAQMLLNLALAYNLSGNTAALENLRLGYGDIMRRTDFQQPFLLVTRTAKEAKLADRSTLLKLVSEVNMFKTVLEDYKNTTAVPKTASSEAKTGQTDQKDQKPVEAGQAAPAAAKEAPAEPTKG
ncbi:MAG: hypothetical protein KGQ41_01335 [Alphaproteobacteria bacterium]|nr:hypothetical protein [Alphaproteobacteria bacterium]